MLPGSLSWAPWRALLISTRLALARPAWAIGEAAAAHAQVDEDGHRGVLGPGRTRLSELQQDARYATHEIRLLRQRKMRIQDLLKISL